MQIIAGARPGTAFSGFPSAAHLATVGDLTGLVEQLSAHRDTRILVLAEPGAPLHEARSARHLAGHRDVSICTLPEMPSVRVHLVRALQHLTDENYGLAPVVRDLFATRLHTRLALTSVTRLTSPNPTMGQHMLSWLPGTRFAVDVTGGTVSRTAAVPWSVNPESFSVASVHNPKNALRLDTAGTNPDVSLEVEGRPKWASRSFAELTEGPRDASDVVAQILAGLEPTTCAKCTHLASDPLCLTCGVLVGAGSAQAPAAEPTTPAPTSLPHGGLR